MNFKETIEIMEHLRKIDTLVDEKIKIKMKPYIEIAKQGEDGKLITSYLGDEIEIINAKLLVQYFVNTSKVSDPLNPQTHYLYITTKENMIPDEFINKNFSIEVIETETGEAIEMFNLSKIKFLYKEISFANYKGDKEKDFGGVTYNILMSGNSFEE